MSLTRLVRLSRPITKTTTTAITTQPRRYVSGGDKLSDETLRLRLSSTVRECSRRELLVLYDAALWIDTSDLTSHESKNRVKIADEVGSNIELKMATTNPYGTGCYATRDFAPNEVITTIRGEINETPTFESVQIEDGKHLHMQRPEVFLNHSCQPNGYIDFKTMQFRALVPIKKGEQLTWNYNTTEWVVQRPFRCHDCGQRILGFAHLNDSDQQQIIKYVSPYIKSKIAKK